MVCLVSQLAFERDRKEKKPKQADEPSSRAYSADAQPALPKLGKLSVAQVGAVLGARRTGLAPIAIGTRGKAGTACGGRVKARQAVDASRQATNLLQAHPFDYREAQAYKDRTHAFTPPPLACSLTNALSGEPPTKMVDRQVRRAPEIAQRPDQPQQLRSGKAYSQWSEQDGGNVTASVDLSTLLQDGGPPTPGDLEEVIILEEGFTALSGEEPPPPSRPASPLELFADARPIAVLGASGCEVEVTGKCPLLTPSAHTHRIHRGHRGAQRGG